MASNTLHGQPPEAATGLVATNAAVTPLDGNPFLIAARDLADAIRMAPVWLHGGWIDVVWRYRRTRLGTFWHTLSLAAFVLVMGIIWSAILKQDVMNYFRYVSVSIICWTLIASLITEGTGILIAGQATALSMRFPYVAFAFAHVWRALLTFGHHFLLYVAVAVGTSLVPGWPTLLAVPALLLVAANGVWMALLAGMLCLRWRDLGPAIASAMQILMFATPIFWPPDLLGPRLAFIADYNPFYHLVRILREPLLGAAPPMTSWLWVVGMLVVGAAVTAWLYGRSRNRLAYWY